MELGVPYSLGDFFHTFLGNTEDFAGFKFGFQNSPKKKGLGREEGFKNGRQVLTKGVPPAILRALIVGRLFGEGIIFQGQGGSRRFKRSWGFRKEELFFPPLFWGKG